MKENSHQKSYRLSIEKWNIVRAIYAIAGLFVAVSVLLGLCLDERWHYFTIFVALMLLNFSLTGYCPMAILLNKMGMKN